MQVVLFSFPPVKSFLLHGRDLEASFSTLLLFLKNIVFPVETPLSHLIALSIRSLRRSLLKKK